MYGLMLCLSVMTCRSLGMKIKSWLPFATAKEQLHAGNLRDLANCMVKFTKADEISPLLLPLVHLLFISFTDGTDEQKMKIAAEKMCSRLIFASIQNDTGWIIANK